MAVDEESHTTLESNRNGIIGHVKRRVYDEDRATPALHIRDPLAGGKRHAGTRGDVRYSADRDSNGAGADVDSFKGSPTDGAYPESGLIGDSAGNLYGTTAIGGASSRVVVFKLDTTGRRWYEIRSHHIVRRVSSSAEESNMIRTKVSRRLALAGFDPAGKPGYANRQERIGSRVRTCKAGLRRKLRKAAEAPKCSGLPLPGAVS